MQMADCGIASDCAIISKNLNEKKNIIGIKSRIGIAVRAQPFHGCNPGSIPGAGATFL